jgi:cbb3-type cytochrome oxidase subunit 3
MDIIYTVFNWLLGTKFAYAASHTYEHSSSNNHMGFIWIIAVLGVVFFAVIYFSYTNRNKSYNYAKKTRTDIKNLQQSDDFQGSYTTHENPVLRDASSQTDSGNSFKDGSKGLESLESITKLAGINLDNFKTFKDV